MLTLYHVSVDQEPKRSMLFTPKIPESCAKWENKDIRIILRQFYNKNKRADSINKCFCFM